MDFDSFMRLQFILFFIFQNLKAFFSIADDDDDDDVMKEKLVFENIILGVNCICVLFLVLVGGVFSVFLFNFRCLFCNIFEFGF